MERMPQRYYILRDRIPVEVDSVETWAKSFQGPRQVASTTIPLKVTWRQWLAYVFGYGPLPEKEIWISTVFLGINHQWGDGPPLLFETMIFGGAHDGYQTRCSTWEQAELQHWGALNLITHS